MFSSHDALLQIPDSDANPSLVNLPSNHFPQESRISVCFVVASIATERAGTEGHLLRLIRGLDRQRFEPLLVVLQRSAWTDEFDDPLVLMRVLGFQSFRRPQDWWRIRRLARILRQHRVQIVETHYPDAHFAGALAARVARVPVVISCRRDLVDQYDRKARTLCSLSNHVATHYLVNSRAVAASASLREGLEQAKIEVIHNGVDLESFAREPEVPAKAEFGAAVAKGPVVVLVANLLPIKNIPVFIQAASIVARRFPEARFAVIGAGPEQDRLVGLTVELGVDDRFIWMGRVSDVRPYLKRATIGCLSSDSEGFSNSILEYMAAGLPVVATRVGGAEEVVLDGITGFLTSPGDARAMADRLQELLADSNKCRVMGQAGRRHVAEHFSLPAQIEAHQRLYERLASTNGSHSRLGTRA